MAKELALSSNSGISYYENRPNEAIKGLMVDRLKELAAQAGAEVVEISSLSFDKVISLTRGGIAGAEDVEIDMTKLVGVGRSTRDQSDPVRAKVEAVLSRHASDAHSEIQHLFVVNLADGGIEFRSESISRNPDMDQAFSGKYAEDTNFLTFLQDPRNHFNLIGTVDSYVFALKFRLDDQDDMALIGRVPMRGDTFHFMAAKKKMERVVSDLQAILVA